MKTKLQFLTLCLAFLTTLSFVKTEDLGLQQIHLNDDHLIKPPRNLEEDMLRPIKIQKFYYDTYFGLFAQFGESNPYTPLVLNMRSPLTWINNISYFARNNKYYQCSESKTCKPEKENKEVAFDENGLIIKGNWVTERMATTGATSPSFPLFVANEISISDKKAFPGSFGLGFRAKDSPFSLFIDSNEGELILGGYNKTKAENTFQKVPLVVEENSLDYTIAVKSISLSGQKNENLKAILDIGSPSIVVPPAIITKVRAEIESKNLKAEKVAIGNFGDLSINCKAINALDDLVLELEGTTVKIPAGSYITVHRGPKRDESDSGCFLSLVPWDEAGNEKKIILGQPFLKTYYTYFEPSAKQVSFSKVNNAGLTYNEAPSTSPWVGFVFLLLIVGGLYWFMKKYAKPGSGSGVSSLFNSGTRLGGAPANPNAGRDRWRHQELSDSLGDNETNP